MTQFDLSSYTGGSSTRKQSIVVFHQCLTHLKNLNASSFQFHPEINNALSILSSELRRLLILELLVDDGSIDATSIEEPAYSIDLSKVLRIFM